MGSSPFVSVWEGFMIMLICIIIGIVLSFAGGLIFDTQITAYEEAGLWDVPEAWGIRGQIGFLTNLYMLLMYGIPVMGILSFVVTIFWRQKYDQYINS